MVSVLLSNGILEEVLADSFLVTFTTYTPLLPIIGEETSPSFMDKALLNTLGSLPIPGKLPVVNKAPPTESIAVEKLLAMAFRSV